MSRDIRRHHLLRMKAKARRVARDSWGRRSSLGWSAEDAEQQQRRAEKWADHLAMCGRTCCNNPRHNGWNRGGHAVTIQEVRRVDVTRRDNPLDPDDLWSNWSKDYW